MFERYNEPARRSLFFSRYEAAILSSLTIETEHLLLGILKDRNPLIAHLVGGQQSADAIRSLTYERAGQPGAPIDTTVEIPFSTDVKHALQYAAEEADRLLHGHIGTEHLLLGVLRLDAGLTCDVLRESGLATQCGPRGARPARQRLVATPARDRGVSLSSSRARRAIRWCVRHDRARWPEPCRRATPAEPAFQAVASVSVRSTSAPGPIVHRMAASIRSADLDVGSDAV